MESTYFRRGFGLKAEIEGQLAADYHARMVEALRASRYRLTVGPLTFRLAREFGFCYGVDRAVEYAYETRQQVSRTAGSFSSARSSTIRT